MSRRIPLLAVALSCGFLACAPQDVEVDAEPAEMAGMAVDMEAELAALQAADAAYSRVAQTKDMEAGLALYAPDALVYPPESPVISGHDGIRTMFEGFMEDPNFTGNFEPVSIVVSADGDMGYTMNLATLTVTGPDGDVITERLNDFHVWRKQPDGSWKVVIDIWNATAPGDGM